MNERVDNIAKGIADLMRKMDADDVNKDGNYLGIEEMPRNDMKMVLIFADTKAEWLIRYQNDDVSHSYYVALVGYPSHLTISDMYKVLNEIRKLLLDVLFANI